MKAFVIDVSMCNGCYCCQLACKDEHVGNEWAPYTKPQPDVGQFWLKLNEFVRGKVPQVKMHYIPVMCMHCDEASCMNECPVEGAIYKRDDGLVVIDPAKCTGCGSCVDACAYHAIYMNQESNIAQKCTGCAHLLDGTAGDDVPRVPRCVDVCPTEALRLVDESEVAELMRQGQAVEVLEPWTLSGAETYETKPRVYYLNIPRRFVAGTVFDPVDQEVVIGARCSLKGSSGTVDTATDGFGDFWFRGLEEGSYSLEIEAPGFTSRLFEDIDTASDVSLGDIALARSAG